jgi:hypothetical protein
VRSEERGVRSQETRLVEPSRRYLLTPRSSLPILPMRDLVVGYHLEHRR